MLLARRTGSDWPHPRPAAWRASVVACALVCPSTWAANDACTLDRATGTRIDPQPFLVGGYAARWNAASDRIAFMQPEESGYYRVFTERADGSDKRALPGPPELPRKHQGAPYWHPSGSYLLLVAQKKEWHGAKLFGIPDYEALPGFGRHDDLWLISADGTRGWQLTNEANTVDEGVLVPVFAADGRRVAWSARLPGGHYALRVADFRATPEPHLENIRSYQPGAGDYYETGSFTTDGTALLYTSDQDTHSFWQSQIYRLDLSSGNSTRLTSGRDYNEHPTVVSTPSGDWVVYMSTKGVDRYPFHLMLGTDWYAMPLAGGAAKRLTTMNLNRPGNPENVGTLQVAGTVSPSPSGEYLLGDVQDHLLRQTGRVKIIRLTCP